MVSDRRKARRIALQALYELDCAGHDPVAAILRLAGDQEISSEAVLFAQEMVDGVLTNQARLDVQICRFAPNFPVEQLSLIDRAILRLSIFEITIDRRAPIKVAINEAVELAKSFGSINSSKFINGVLRSVSSTVLQS